MNLRAPPPQMAGLAEMWPDLEDTIARRAGEAPAPACWTPGNTRPKRQQSLSEILAALKPGEAEKISLSFGPERLVASVSARTGATFRTEKVGAVTWLVERTA